MWFKSTNSVISVLYFVNCQEIGSEGVIGQTGSMNLTIGIDEEGDSVSVGKVRIIMQNRWHIFSPLRQEEGAWKLSYILDQIISVIVVSMTSRFTLETLNSYLLLIFLVFIFKDNVGRYINLDYKVYT